MLWMPEPKCTPACASSSSTTAAWAKLPPPPPYASGRSGSSMPTPPALVHAVAERLDERFLASPALKESQRPVARVERLVPGVLAARKAAGGQIVGIGNRPDGFDVDAELGP